MRSGYKYLLTLLRKINNLSTLAATFEVIYTHTQTFFVPLSLASKAPEVSPFDISSTTLFKFIILLTALTLANAITIRNWSRTGYSGNYRACTNIPVNTCCRSTTAAYSSSRFIGILETELGAVCTRTGSKYCGTVKAANIGPLVCVNKPAGNTLGPRGSLWYDCLSCMKWGAGNNTVLASEDFVEKASKPMGEALEDRLVIDGHSFELNHPSQPQPVIDAFNNLYDEDATYDKIAADVRKWEVAMTAEDA